MESQLRWVALVVSSSSPLTGDRAPPPSNSPRSSPPHPTPSRPPVKSDDTVAHPYISLSYTGLSHEVGSIPAACSRSETVRRPGILPVASRQVPLGALNLSLKASWDCMYYTRMVGRVKGDTYDSD
ncbi:hypothetical protein CONPUDRAFT_137738 [Coniophora puteana RWD-64-598 SS2]|uniref:Uncharacterized protein n=1 Tax=Coniophora puteana (strain RWD-64-598) TaxID=741705 RepID=A0A5M3MN79_CONPW|nr:uncharacterized protein CONPUDRAFT_137738 [Coniophora puteana RWD-64-598 SS2]EIW80632.1 hypothetical protein CONPUDRAFT_137738 [Coniophora puteana RWD-64-598 SS2]